MSKKIFTTIVFSLTFVMFSLAQGEWVLEKNIDGIKVYNRKIENSKLKEFKGTVVLNASVDDVLKVLSNYKLHDQFVYKAKKGSVELLKGTKSDIYTYMVINTPWPASNRDVVTHYHINAPRKDGSVRIDVKSVNGMKPEQSGIVRVEEMKGYWELIPLSKGKVEVTHQAFSKPGGRVPDGLANAASVSAPYDMLESLKKIVE